MKITNIISYVPNRRGVAAGVLTVVGVLGFGLGLGVVTGVINVPFAEACCVVSPSPSPAPAPAPAPVPPLPLPVTIVGCTDEDATNYNPDATSPANDSCTYVTGCTDPAALNYDSNAKKDDGSCEYPQKPTCSLTVAPDAINKGDSSTLTWSTTNADQFKIDNIPTMPIAGGSMTVSPETTTTYTGVATGPGGTVTCPVTITVTTTPPPPKTKCTLSADPLFILTGATSTLAWTTENADTFTIDQGIGSVATTSGTRVVTPSGLTTYTGTAVGPGGTVTCDATIMVTVLPPPEPSCTLAADPTAVDKGNASTLSWTTTNADTFSINQSIGNVATTSGATSTAALYNDTTYTGTVTGHGYTKTCTVTVTTKGGGGGGGPACTLSVSPVKVTNKGDRAVLSWTTFNAISFTIDHGIGSVTPVAVGTTTTGALFNATTYIGTATDSGGKSITCSTTVDVPSGGCSSGCCSGNCGGSHPATIALSTLPHVNIQPLAYLYLSQIPYTGIDLGSVGTVVYWLVLLALSAALSYLFIFKVLPYASRQGRAFLARVNVLAQEPAYVAAAVPSVAPAPAKRELSSDAPRYHSPYEGFKSFGTNGALSIEDIVKGLSRQPLAPHTEPIFENVEPIDEPDTEAAPQPGARAADARGLALAIIHGDRVGAFAGLRQHARGGGAPHALVSAIACLIDDAYRARIEGTRADEAVTRAAARLDTPTLEKLVTALTTAIDSSYQDSMTGAKLALTRALTTLGA